MHIQPINVAQGYQTNFSGKENQLKNKIKTLRKSIKKQDPEMRKSLNRILDALLKPESKKTAEDKKIEANVDKLAHEIGLY